MGRAAPNTRAEQVCRSPMPYPRMDVDHEGTRLGRADIGPPAREERESLLREETQEQYADDDRGATSAPYARPTRAGRADAPADVHEKVPLVAEKADYRMTRGVRGVRRGVGVRARIRYP